MYSKYIFQVAIPIKPFINKEWQILDITTLSIQFKKPQLSFHLLKLLLIKKLHIKFNWIFYRMVFQKEIFETTLYFQFLQIIYAINFNIASYGTSGFGQQHKYYQLFQYRLLKHVDQYGQLIRSINNIVQTIQNKIRNIFINFFIWKSWEKGVIIHLIKEIENSTTIQKLIQLIHIAKKIKSLKKIRNTHILIFYSRSSTSMVTKIIFASLGSIEMGIFYKKKKKNIHHLFFIEIANQLDFSKNIQKAILKNSLFHVQVLLFLIMKILFKHLTILNIIKWLKRLISKLLLKIFLKINNNQSQNKLIMIDLLKMKNQKINLINKFQINSKLKHFIIQYFNRESQTYKDIQITIRINHYKNQNPQNKLINRKKKVSFVKK
ncbi:unnamed protein product [Paramecium sonneborni]|uniref:Uncharacterized protein n=1 Tax=Paramecium sonneborni TaxID=65129 RepID=A0A8S1MI39_9CILI|nr:unnamed protein product [Paramecium sonneborni]